MAPEPLHIEAGFARHFDQFARPSDHPGSEATALHLSYGAHAQLSALPDRSGFLIRVWSGEGLDEFAAVVEFGPDLRPSLTSLRWDNRTIQSVAAPEDPS